MTGAPWIAIAFAYHLASRLAYVLYVGVALRRQERAGYFTRRYGAAEGFRRFRRAAAILMGSDAVGFVALCVVSRNTLAIASPRGLVLAAGVVLVVVGVLTNAWAAATLGGRAYSWLNFRGPATRTTPRVSAPYRVFTHPRAATKATPNAPIRLASAPNSRDPNHARAVYIALWRPPQPTEPVPRLVRKVAPCSARLAFLPSAHSSVSLWSAASSRPRIVQGRFIPSSRPLRRRSSTTTMTPSSRGFAACRWKTSKRAR